jgi:hypothetical protein
MTNLGAEDETMMVRFPDQHMVVINVVGIRKFQAYGKGSYQFGKYARF